jgi:putative transposase
MSKKKRPFRPVSPPSVGGDLPPCPAFERAPGAPFPPEVREHALLLVASGMKRTEVARRIGGSTETLRLWIRAAKENGGLPMPPLPVPAPAEEHPPAASMPQRAAEDPGQGLAAHEEAAIVELKQRYPSMGPAQIRAQLKRFKGWRLSVRAIARVLTKHGYELVHTASRPKDEEEVSRFEAPWPNALWQMDFAELRIGAERRACLILEDDMSRFSPGHALLDNPTSEDVVAVLDRAIHRHGKPEAIYTDRGGPFLAWGKASSLGKYLEKMLITHHVSPAYRPRGRGKIESLVGTLKRELWEVRHFGSVPEAARAIDEFFLRYNHARAHMGIGGLTPADRYFGRAPEVLEKVEAASRRRQGALSVKDDGRDPFVTEELLPGGPVEMLRLLVTGGRMFLTFLGHRVDLGEVKS